jgi:hypothetical protein
VFQMIVSEVGRMTSSSSRREALDVFGLLLQEALGDEEGEVGVDVPGVLEHAVEGPLHALPQGVAVGLDDHAAAHVGVLGEPGAVDDVEIPLRVVLGPARDLVGGHDSSSARSANISIIRERHTDAIRGARPRPQRASPAPAGRVK